MRRAVCVLGLAGLLVAPGAAGGVNDAATFALPYERVWDAARAALAAEVAGPVEEDRARGSLSAVGIVHPHEAAETAIFPLLPPDLGLGTRHIVMRIEKQPAGVRVRVRYDVEVRATVPHSTVRLLDRRQGGVHDLVEHRVVRGQSLGVVERRLLAGIAARLSPPPSSP